MINLALTGSSGSISNCMPARLKRNLWTKITIVANLDCTVSIDLTVLPIQQLFPIAMVPLHSIGPTIVVPSPTGHPIPRSNFRFILHASGFVPTKTWLIKNRFNVLLIPFKCSILLRFICVIPSIIQYFCAAAGTVFKQSLRRVAFDDFPC